MPQPLKLLLQRCNELNKRDDMVPPCRCPHIFISRFVFRSDSSSAPAPHVPPSNPDIGTAAPASLLARRA